MFEIYSIGDGAFLASVLNAVAMLSGSGDMRQLAGIGFLVGVSLVMFQGMFQSRFPPLQNVFVAWVIYAGMFGPVVRVSVEDVYTGAVRVVDNVPLGPAVFGSAMSQVGYGVTRLFEQAFSTPAMTDYGFAAPLQLLQNVRKGTLSRVALGAANSPTPGADVERSWVNYITECTLYEVDIGARSIEDVLKNPSWQTFATGLMVPTTELWLGGAAVTKECDDAWVDLSRYTETTFWPALQRTLAATLHLSVADVPGAVQASLDAIAGAGVDAQNYMIMATAVPFLEKAQAQVYQELAQWENAAMVTQAVQQRNTQWAAEETLFSRIVRPMMTFFEAFLFAVSPLMVFVIGLGPTGIRMVGKYLLFGLWIQLWQPILAIINLYILMAIGGKLDALQAAGIGSLQLPSAYAMWKLDFLLSNYLGVGGMLAASTPAISLMLIYGSAITATHLAGRLQGGDHINEKIVSPDAMQPAAALAMSPIQTHAPLTGTTTPHANSVLWTANVGRSMQESVRSSERAMQEASTRFGSALSSAASASASRSGETFDARAQGWDYAASGSQTDKTLLSESESLVKKLAEQGMSKETLNANLGLRGNADSGALISRLAGVTAGALAGGGGAADRTRLGAGISANLESTYGTDKSIADQIGAEMARKVGTDSGFEARLAESVKADSQSGRRNVFSERLSSEESARLERSAGDAVSASRTLERDQSMEQRFGVLGSYGAVEIGHAIASDPLMLERLYHEIDRRNLTGDHQRLASSWAYARNMTHDAARAAAGVALLIGHADGETLRKFTPLEAQGAKEAGYGILADTFGASRPGSGMDAYRNADLETAAPRFGSARAAVGAAGLQDPSGRAAGLRDEIRHHGGTVDSQYAPAAAGRFYGEGRGAVVDRGRELQGRIRAEKRDRIGAMIDQKAMLPPPLAQVAHHELGGTFVKLGESGALLRAGGGAMANQAAAAVSAFGSALASGDGLPAAIRAGREAAGGETGWSQAREAMIQARMGQIAGYDLTPAQQGLFRETTESLFRFAPSEAQQTARQAVIEEAGGDARGQHIAALIERSANARDDSDLRLIGNYNSQGLGPEKKSERAGRRVIADPEGASAMVDTARRLGLDPVELVAMMSWESGGTLNPWVAGGDRGVYRGLIQFSPENQRIYGIHEGQSIAQQMTAVERYLLDRGFVPGQHAIEHAYAAILAGRADERYWDREDSNRTTVRNAVGRFRSGPHVERALDFLRRSQS